jgi:hypothetical protein
MNVFRYLFEWKAFAVTVVWPEGHLISVAFPISSVLSVSDRFPTLELRASNAVINNREAVVQTRNHQKANFVNYLC